MPDGLDALENRRPSTNRRIPPSRHKPRTTPVPVKAAEEVAADTPPAAEAKPAKARESAGPAAPAETPGTPSPSKTNSKAVTPPKKASSPSAKDASEAPVVERLAKHTIHLGSVEDEFLEDVFIAGRRSKAGRVDANRSAVVRLALRRLADEQTPAQIVDTIRKGTSKPATGRPRF